MCLFLHEMFGSWILPLKRRDLSLWRFLPKFNNFLGGRRSGKTWKHKLFRNQKKGKPLEEKMISCWLLVVSNLLWHNRIVAQNTRLEKLVVIVFSRYSDMPFACGKWTAKSTSLPPTIAEFTWIWRRKSGAVNPFSNDQAGSKENCALNLNVPHPQPATQKKSPNGRKAAVDFFDQVNDADMDHMAKILLKKCLWMNSARLKKQDQRPHPKNE